MHVIHGFDHVPANARRAVLAIGNFDGVHKGHQALIAKVRALAATTAKTMAGAMIFEPHPRLYFQPNAQHFQLTPLAMKLDLLERYGLDLAAVLAFDRSLAVLTADEFIERVLVAGLGVRHVVVGYDFHFGKGRSGSPEALVAAGREMGFDVTVLDPVRAGGDVASSSAIRTALAEGEVERAAMMLGHWWRAEGVVSGGAKRGTGMGYPTANIALHPGADLAHGIYAARVHVNNDVHLGAAYLGTRPTFDNGRPLLETFLLDFDGDLYDRTITVEFIARIRPDQAFTDMPSLIAQMNLDVAACRRILAGLETSDPHRWPAAI